MASSLIKIMPMSPSLSHHTVYEHHIQTKLLCFLYRMYDSCMMLTTFFSSNLYNSLLFLTLVLDNTLLFHYLH